MANRARPRLRVAHRRLLVLEARDITGPTTHRSALVLAPHPDDETIGAGATIARKVAAGTPVRVVVAADGNDSTRRAECREACRRLGLPDDALTFLGLPDGALAEHQADLRDAIRSVVEEMGPAELIMPSAIDTHPDHRALAATVRRHATDDLRAVQVLSYPIWYWNRWAWTDRHRARATQTMDLLWRPLLHTATTRTRIVRTGEYLDVKQHALAAHRSQVDASWGDPDRKVLDPAWLTMFLGTEELFFAES
jgi:LmbE family N-acetylglucosaminyl deacetylase